MSAGTKRHMYESFYRTKGAAGLDMALWLRANIVKRRHGSSRVGSTQGPYASGTVLH